MPASSAWRGRLLCAAVLALATALPSCAGAATFQRDSRFILPSSPDTSAWLSPPEVNAEPFAAAPIQGFVKASRSCLCCYGAEHLLIKCSNMFVACRRLGPTLWWTVEFLSLRAATTSFWRSGNATALLVRQVVHAEATMRFQQS